MDETKVELYAQLGEISVMLGKLKDEKKSYIVFWAHKKRKRFRTFD